MIGYSGFNLTGEFLKENHSVSVSVILRENNKKELYVEKEMISPFSSHIGKLPVVFIAPDDISLITGNSEERRKMMDTIISQTDQEYLSVLIRYNKSLQERNRYFKSLEGMPADDLLIDSFDDQLIRYGTIILERRKSFLNEFLTLALDLYAYISSSIENPILTPAFSTQPDLYALDMKKSRQKDLVLQRTSVGIHKDEIEFLMMDMPFKQMASQGQKKSLLFALKLAEFEYLKKHFGAPPILLLDDIFEKLDQQRLNQLLHWVGIKNEGQVILTDTHAERVEKSLDDISLPFHLINP